MRIDARFHSRHWLALIPLLAALQAAAMEPTPVREADAACAGCHEKIFQSYLATPMANASGLAGENLHPGTFMHVKSGMEYRIVVNDKQDELQYRSVRATDVDGAVPLRYFLGSGHLGATYLYSIGDFLFDRSEIWRWPTTRRCSKATGRASRWCGSNSALCATNWPTTRRDWMPWVT